MTESSNSPVRRVSNKPKATPEQKSSAREDVPLPLPTETEQPSQKRQNRRRRNKSKQSSPREVESKQPELEGQIESSQPPAAPKPSQERAKIDPEQLSKKSVENLPR